MDTDTKWTLTSSNSIIKDYGDKKVGLIIQHKGTNGTHLQLSIKMSVI